MKFRLIRKCGTMAANIKTNNGMDVLRKVGNKEAPTANKKAPKPKIPDSIKSAPPDGWNEIPYQ